MRRQGFVRYASDLSRSGLADGPVGFDGPAQRKREFAADMGLQAHALRMAAEGAVAAYEQVVGERWKPFERPADPSAPTLDRKAAELQIAAFG
ncbi:MAG: ArgG [Proteobacteria bacterium]|nr:ArgG [Pseudomonadota bacterium]